MMYFGLRGVLRDIGHSDTKYDVVEENLMLDDFPGSFVAWSLRKLRNAYSGSCIRVRRSSDDSEQDIGFSSNALDTTDLDSFCGSNSCYVVTWYDQSGNGCDITHATASKQPRIVNSGTLETVNSLPAVLFDGTDDVLISADGFDCEFSAFAGYQVVAPTNAALADNGHGVTTHYGDDGAETYWTLNGNSGLVSLETITFLGKDNNNTVNWRLGTTLLAHSWSAGEQLLYDLEFLTSGTDYNVNNSSVTIGITNQINASSDATSSALPNTDMSSVQVAFGALLAQGGDIFVFDGHVQEVVHWHSDQSSNRTDIRSNINTYWGVY